MKCRQGPIPTLRLVLRRFGSNMGYQGLDHSFTIPITVCSLAVLMKPIAFLPCPYRKLEPRVAVMNARTVKKLKPQIKTEIYPILA